MLFADDFEKKKYPNSNMSSILRTTFTVSSHTFKPSSVGAKYVKEKLECLSKEHTEKSVEETTKNVDKGKRKVEEPQKKRNCPMVLVVSRKFGTSASAITMK